MKEGVQFHSYVKILVGHESCDTSRWVWVGGGAERVFVENWKCPVCGMFMGMGEALVQVDVPVGCLFVEKEVGV